MTTAKHPECKRGIAVNIAASLARHNAISGRVCVVDADPASRDVSTRLHTDGPVLEDFAKRESPGIARLSRLYSPAMSVVPCRNNTPTARVRLAAERALGELKAAFDVVVCDLPVGPTGPGLAVGGRLDLLDWLILAVTPEPAAMAATDHFLEHFHTAKQRGDIGDVNLAVVATGDENSTRFEPAEIEELLGVALAGRIPQLWGRSVPNEGFGPALAIPELDDAVYDVFMSFRMGHDYRPDLVTL